MTPEQFAFALQRGSGQAALCLLENDPEPYLPSLLEACLHDYRWTVWTEEPRGPYLLSLAAIAGVEDLVEEVLLRGLPKLEREWDETQAWRMLAELAKKGRPRARSAVLSYALRHSQGVSLVASWGASALGWLIAVRSDLFLNPEYRKIRFWIESAKQMSGKEAVEAVLTPAIRAARQADSERVPAPPRLSLKIETIDKLIASLQGVDRQARRYRVRNFGTFASPAEKLRLAERMLSLSQPRLIALLANAFHQEPWPLDLEGAYDRSNDPRVGESWRRVLDSVENPKLREWAWDFLERDPIVWDALDWLEINYQPGDEDRLWALLQKVDPTDECLRHNVSLSLRKIYKRVGVRDLVPHLEWQLETTPCSSCRVDTHLALAKEGLLAERYFREAPYDAEPEIRKLVTR